MRMSRKQLIRENIAQQEIIENQRREVKELKKEKFEADLAERKAEGEAQEERFKVETKISKDGDITFALYEWRFLKVGWPGETKWVWYHICENEDFDKLKLVMYEKTHGYTAHYDGEVKEIKQGNSE